MKKLLIIVGMLIGFNVYAAPSVSDLWQKCALKSTSGCTKVTIDGFNAGITTSNEPLWPESSAYTVLTAAMSTPYCASTDNTNDKSPSGTGALTVRVSGITTSYAAFSETVTMNGQTSVNLATSSVLFINSIEVLTAGSTGSNTGIIRCGTGTNTTGVPAVVHAHLPIGWGKTESAMYGVPDNYSLLCKDFVYSSYGVTAAQTVQFTISQTYSPTSGRLDTADIAGYLNQAGSSGLLDPYIFKFGEKTILRVQALSAASTGPAHVSADCILVSDAWLAEVGDL